jgi:integration host factor subunit beta
MPGTSGQRCGTGAELPVGAPGECVIEIRGFGSFNLHQRPPRSGRNPKTGVTVYLPAKVKLHFKPGKDMKDRVNAARNKCPITD